MSTRENILKASLELFALKGYEGVSVREIGRAVGVRESALYKHFKNKEDILENVISKAKERIAEAYVQNQLPEVMGKDLAEGYNQIIIEKLCEISWNLFLIFTQDPVVSNIRKLLMREQFSNHSIAKHYDDFFIQGVLARQEKVFSSLIEKGFFKEEEPKMLALHFYSPIFLIFQSYDCDPKQEEKIKTILFLHVQTFSNNYVKR